jgi:hypothetical protein
MSASRQWPLTIAVLVAATAVGASIRIGLKRSAIEAVSTGPPEWMEGWRQLNDHGMLSGDSASPVQIIEFVDLQCPVCRSQHAALRGVQDRLGAGVSVRYVHLPLPRHPFSGAAAVAAECAYRQGLLSQFLESIYRKQESIGSLPWTDFIPSVTSGDSQAFTRCLQNPAIAERVASDQEAAYRFDVEATPTLVVNGWRFSGLLTESQLQDVIGRLSRGALPSGVSVHPDKLISEFHRRIGASEQSINPMAPGPVALSTTSASDPEFDLTNVADVELLRDGRVVTFADLGVRLLVFGRDGRGERRIMRPGRGPGELHNASNVSLLRGDSLVLLDRGNGKLVTVVPSSGVVRETTLGGASALSMDRIAGRLPNGALVLYQSMRRPQASGKSRARAQVRVVTFRLDTIPREVGTFEAGEYSRIETRYRGRQRSELVPVRLAGGLHLAVLDSTIIVAAGPTFRLEFLDPLGARVGIVEDTTRRRAVSPLMRTTQTAAELQRLRKPGAEPLIDAQEAERLVREAPFADSVGAVGGLFVSRDDHILWVLATVAPGDKEWRAIGVMRNGAIYGNIRGEVSRGLPVSFRGNRVALLHEDAEGASRVSVYPLLSAKP